MTRETEQAQSWREPDPLPAAATGAATGGATDVMSALASQGQSAELLASMQQPTATPVGGAGDRSPQGRAAEAWRHWGQSAGEATDEATGTHCLGLSAFAVAFNDTFGSILHAFAAGGGGAGDPATSTPGDFDSTKTQAPGSRSGDDLDDARLAQLFTEAQRAALLAYCLTGAIPERLFNGDELGGTTAQQRILLASHILAHGHYRPDSDSQKVHAKMCFHWAHLVHHYAGVTQGGLLTDGVMGSTDHSGQIIFGGDRSASTKRGARRDAPEREARRQQALEAAQAAYDAAVASGEATPNQLRRLQSAVRDAGRKANLDFFRHQPLDAEEFRGLQAGDWIYYHNDNSSRSGDHSVIFSRWLTGEKSAGGPEEDATEDGEPVLYRQAEVFSQGRPDSGGRQHTAWLGTRYTTVGDIRVNPVTRRSRLPADARPARTVEELLPLPGHLRHPPGEGASARKVAAYEKRLARYANGIDQKNGQTMKRALRGQSYDEAQLGEAIRVWLRGQNRGLIDGLASRLTDGQRALLLEANGAQQPLTTVIRLNERLRGLGTNVVITVRNEVGEAEDYEDEVAKGAEKWRAAAHKALDGLEKRAVDAHGALAALDDDLGDHALPTTRGLIDGDAIGELLGDIGRMRQCDPSWTLDDEAALLGEIVGAAGELRGALGDARTELRKVRRRPASFKAADRPLRYLSMRVPAFERAVRDAQKKTPYVTAHGGSNRGGAKSKTTGLLANVPDIPWAELARRSDADG